MREANGLECGGSALALGSRAGTRPIVQARARGGGMRVLLVMDPFIRVPPAHYGGIERVVADLADGLARQGHEITLWAAPGSRIQGRIEPFGEEGEWTRWSNARNTATLAGRFLAGAHRFDVVHNFGRLAYLAPILARDIAKVQTYMRTVNPTN